MNDLSPPTKRQPFWKTFEGYVFYEVSNKGELTKQGQLGIDGRTHNLPAFTALHNGDLLRAQSWVNVRVGPDKQLRKVNVARIFECVRLIEDPDPENITSSHPTRTGGWIKVEHADCKPLY